jgi:predicted DNA-binding protein
MAQKKNQVKFGVNNECAKRLRHLSDLTGHPISYLIDQMSLIVDYVPDNACRATLGIFPRVENSSIFWIIAPIFAGIIRNVPNSVSDEELDKIQAEKAQKAIEGEEPAERVEQLKQLVKRHAKTQKQIVEEMKKRVEE